MAAKRRIRLDRNLFCEVTWFHQIKTPCL
jgi:hypothetical protein